MCLATVYKTMKDTEEVVLKNVSKIYVEGDSVRLIDIMGAEVVVEGAISFVDLTGLLSAYEKRGHAVRRQPCVRAWMGYQYC